VTVFPIRQDDRSRAQAVEMLGSKPKFWFRDGESRLLFKADDRGTGEDWAEIVACHLCHLLGLPHVEYELAAEYDGDRCMIPFVIDNQRRRTLEALNELLTQTAGLTDDEEAGLERLLAILL
jgi:hypothetical protein